MLRRVSDPLTQQAKLAVVSVADLKLHARITHDDEDAIIPVFIEAAFDYLHGPDGWLNGFCILKERFEVLTDRVDRCPLVLEARPYAGTPNFDMIDDAGAYQTVAVDRYRIDGGPFYSSLATTGMGSFLAPLAYRNSSSVFRVRFDAGCASAAVVPASIKLAIKMLAGHWFANREATTSDNRAVPTKIELGLKALCRSYRLGADHS